MNITSEKAYIAANQKEVYDFLCKSENIYHLLPQDKISDFQSDEHGCSFKVQGGIIIPLLYSQHHPHTKINMKSGEKAPFKYHLAIVIGEDGEHKCDGHIEFHAEINMFMKMMVEKPLINLFNYMSNRLQEQFSK